MLTIDSVNFPITHRSFSGVTIHISLVTVEQGKLFSPRFTELRKIQIFSIGLK